MAALVSVVCVCGGLHEGVGRGETKSFCRKNGAGKAESLTGAGSWDRAAPRRDDLGELDRVQLVKHWV